MAGRPVVALVGAFADDDAPLPGLEDEAPLSCGIDCAAADYPVTSYDV